MIGETQILPITEKKLNWAEANEICNSFADGWRIPTIAELHLIYEQQRSMLQPLCYWSKTDYVPDYALYFNFGDDIPRIVSCHKGVAMNTIFIRTL